MCSCQGDDEDEYDDESSYYNINKRQEEFRRGTNGGTEEKRWGAIADEGEVREAL